MIKALWWVEDEKQTYGPVRAKIVFVSEFDGSGIKLKLGPTALGDMVHWTGMSTPLTASALSWGYGTFLWELFAFGIEPLPGISPIESDSLYK